MEQIFFEGHLLDHNGDVFGAFPSVNSIWMKMNLLK